MERWTEKQLALAEETANRNLSIGSNQVVLLLIAEIRQLKLELDEERNKRAMLQDEADRGFEFEDMGQP